MKGVTGFHAFRPVRRLYRAGVPGITADWQCNNGMQALLSV